MFPRHTKSTETGFGEALEVMVSECDPTAASPAVIVPVFVGGVNVEVRELT